MDLFERKSLTITEFTVFSCSIGKSVLSVPPRDFHSLSYRLSGSTEIISGDISLVSARGAVTYVPKGATYSHIVKVPSDMIALHFTAAESFESDIAVAIPQNGEEAEKLFKALLGSWEHHPESGNIKCLSIIYRILASLCIKKDNVGEGKNKNRRLIEPAAEYLREHYTDSSLSVSYLAFIAGVSEAYFRRVFAQTFGIQPVKYIRRLRIENAKRLLETGYYSVSEVAFRSGFASASYFSSEFRRETGISPREYTEYGG